MKLEEIRALIEAATPGPWNIGYEAVGADSKCSDFHERNFWRALSPIVIGLKQAETNAAFIAASRILMPKLLAVAEAAQDELHAQRGIEAATARLNAARKRKQKALAALEAHK